MIESVLLGVCALAAVGCVALLALALSRLAVLARDRERGAIDAAALMARLDAAAKGAAEHERDMRGDLAMARNEQADTAANLRREVGERLAQFQAGTQRALADAREAQRGELAQFGERLGTLTAAVEQKLEVLRNDNTAKLEQMRATVDEKLQATLEKRLGDSFSLVPVSFFHAELKNSTMFLPNRMMMPEMASATKAYAVVQWIDRSHGVKRRMRTPVRGACSGIAPLIT